MEFVLLCYNCCIPKFSEWTAEAARRRRQVPDISVLLQIEVGLSQTDAGRLSGNIWGVNTPSWHDTRCQRLQTSSRRRKHKFYPASFSLELIFHTIEEKHIFWLRLCQYIWCSWKVTQTCILLLKITIHSIKKPGKQIHAPYMFHQLEILT